MSPEMKRMHQSGEYEIVGLSEKENDENKESLFFVRHEGAPQAIPCNTVPEALETATLMNRVLQGLPFGIIRPRPPPRPGMSPLPPA
ncbi:MAG: hypothetical protein D084_Lepto4C00416G0003 [Leptospirillum sp. Group IV 'UBA BS']|nr:MAG: hypothetical protein D084_Lepto4C00416G0003 [Leptospirillum sp. Group IV 'UBA BS']